MGTFDLVHGLGMLAVGITAILIGALIIWKVINIMKDNEKAKQEEMEREKIYGRDI